MCLAALAIFMLSLASTLTQTRQQQDVQFSMTATPADRLNIGDKVTVNLTLTGVVTTTNLQLRIRTHRYISVIGAKATVDCFSSYICTGVAFPYTANHIAQLTIDEVEAQILSVQKFYTKWTVAVQLILQVTNRRDLFDFPQNGSFATTIVYLNRFGQSLRATKQLDVSYMPTVINAYLRTENLTTHNGYLSTYLNEELWMNTELMVAEGAARVLLEFVVPHNAYTYQTCSGGGAPGGGTPHCNKIGFVSLQVDPPDRNTITVIVGDSLTSDNFLAPNVTFSANLERVFFDFGIVRNVEDGVLNAADTILIKIPILIRQGYNRVGQVLPFRSIANQTLLPLPTSVIADLTLLVIGPDLSIYTQAQPLSDIEAGTVVNFTTTFFHSTASTENIVQLQVWAKTQDAGMRMLPEVIYFFSGSQDMPYRVTAAELESGIKIGFLNQTDWMRLLFQVRATNSLLINSHPAVRIDASFSGERERKISKSYTTVSTRTVAAKNLLYRSDIGFRTGIRVDEPVTITLTMNMPLGTLNDLSIRAEFKSSDFDEIPIVMINSEVQSSASIHFGPDAANSTGFSVRAMPKPSSLSRRDVTESVANHGCPRCDNSVKQEATEHRIKKRQIQSSLYIVRWIGDVLNPSLGGTSYDAFNITLQFIVPASDAVRHGQLLSFMPTMVFSGRPFDFGRHTFMIVEPRLEIIKTMQYTDDSLPNEIHMNVLVSHQEESSAPAFDIFVQDNYRGMRIENYTMYMPDGSTGNLTVEADSFIFFVDTLAVGKSLLLSYLASPQEALNQETAANRSYNFNASMLYRSIRPSEALSPEFPGRKYGPVETTVCVETRHESVKQLQLQHGYTVLAVIMAILLGFIVSLLFMYVVSRSDTCRRCLQGRCRQHQRRVQPSDVAQDDEQTGEPQVSNLTINSVVDPKESIEPLLGLGDRLQKQKDLDSLDIACSKQRDIVLEEQRTQAVLDATNIMIGNMQARGEVSPSVAARCMTAFQEYWQLSQDRLRAQHQQQMSATLVDNNRSSKAAQDEMTSRHEQERLDLTSKLDSLVIGDEEKTELVDLQQQQHEAERRELQYNLLLQQEQALQQLSQEFAVQKSLSLRRGIMQLLTEIHADSDLSADAGDVMMKQHIANMSAIDRMFDEETSRQQTALEEMLGRRTDIVDQRDKEDEMNRHFINTLVSRHIQTVQDHIGEDGPDRETARAVIAQMHADVTAIEVRVADERTRQQLELHAKLSDLKKQRLHEKAKDHEKEVENFKSKQEPELCDGTLDVVTYMRDMGALVSQQRIELDNMEAVADGLAAAEMSALSERLADGSSAAVRQKLHIATERLIGAGMSEEQIEELEKQISRELEQLRQDQAAEKQRLNEAQIQREEKRATVLRHREEDELRHQEHLRREEPRLLRKLITSQTSLSDEERDRIMAEYERHVVQLQRRLTTERLRQKQILAENLATRRRHLLEKLEQKIAKNDEIGLNGKKSDAGTQAAEIRKTSQETLALFCEPPRNLDAELEKVREAMLRERTETEQRQEDHLGAVIAELQLSKAKEMVTIEAQRQTIASLRSSLIEDLQETGLINDTDATRILQQHQQQQQKLDKAMEAGRCKQEEVLRRKLEDRVKQKETRLTDANDHELSGEPVRDSSASTQVKQVQSELEHLEQSDELRQSMEQEMTRELSDLQRQLELKQQQSLKKQELELVRGLMRLGHFNQTELERVLQLLFPKRSDKKLQAILNGIRDEQPGSAGDDGPGSLEDRTTMLDVQVKAESTATSKKAAEKPTGSCSKPEVTTSKKKKKKKAKKQPDSRTDTDLASTQPSDTSQASGQSFEMTTTGS